MVVPVDFVGPQAVAIRVSNTLTISGSQNVFFFCMAFCVSFALLDTCSSLARVHSIIVSEYVILEATETYVTCS